MSTSRSLNKVMLIGNITRDPSLKETPNGGVVSTFGIATNSTWKDADNNIQERTEFHNVVAWNKLAEITAQILSTGMLVYVEGELRTRTWDDENGVRHFRTEVKIDDLKLLDKKGRDPVGIEGAKDRNNSVRVDQEVVLEEVEDKKEKEDNKEKPERKGKKEGAEDEDISREAEELF
ncbi:single-stranded DNA-binding protein [Candidatus Dojkabacteria bacterium]|nr:single-stranded DNA-binding protein [Candidatus Dojkabacteria bacterium]